MARTPMPEFHFKIDAMSPWENMIKVSAISEDSNKSVNPCNLVAAFILSELQIRRGNRDNLGISSHISPLKHIL